jgi:hypothetical protein
MMDASADILDMWRPPDHPSTPLAGDGDDDVSDTGPAASARTPTRYVCGVRELATAEWRAYSVLRPYTPPCISTLLDACAGPAATRHLKYAERRLVFAFLMGISGLAAQPQGLRQTWFRLFARHTDGTLRQRFFPAGGDEVTVDGLLQFNKSDYGSLFIKSMRQCKPHNREGCGFACANSLCPFEVEPSTMTTASTMPDGMKQRLIDIEDAGALSYYHPSMTHPAARDARLANVWARSVQKYQRRRTQTADPIAPPSVARDLCNNYLFAVLITCGITGAANNVNTSRPINAYASMADIIKLHTDLSSVIE